MMDISTDYKIVAFDETIGQLQIKFDVIPYLIPLDLHPDEDGHLLEGEQLDQFIRGACPIGYVIRQRIFNEGIKNLDSIKALVQPLPEETSSSSEEQSLLSAEEIDQLINSIKSNNT